MRIINANFTKLFYGQAISSIGDFVFDTTLILWISARLLAGKSYAPAAVSGVLVAVALATIIVGPVAGVFVDRWDKRRTMLGADLLRAVLVAGLAVLALLPAHTVPAGVSLAIIYSVVFLATGVSQFFRPARFALIGDIVPGDAERAKAAGLSQSLGYTAAIVGPPLAAPLLFAAGAYWALILNAASFLVSFALIRAIRLAPAPAAEETPGPEPTTAVVLGAEAEMEQATEAPEKRGFLPELVAGLGFIRGSTVTRTLMIAITVMTLGAGALNALMIFFVTGNLHAHADLYGTIGMGEGIGAVAGTLLAAWFCRRLGDVRVFWLGLVTAGIGIIIFARLDHLVTAIALLALLGIPVGAMNVALTPILLRAVPREILGRVNGALTPVQYLASMLSALVAGWLVSTVLRDVHWRIGPVAFGRIDTVFVACGVLVLLAGVYAAVRLRSAPVAAAATDPVGHGEVAPSVADAR